MNHFAARAGRLIACISLERPPQDHAPELTFPQTTINSMVEVVAAKDEANNENFG